jgi:hypothetical protein
VLPDAIEKDYKKFTQEKHDKLAKQFKDKLEEIKVSE